MAPLTAVCALSLTPRCSCSCCCCCCASVGPLVAALVQEVHAPCLHQASTFRHYVAAAPGPAGHCKPALPLAIKSLHAWTGVLCFCAGSLRSNLDVKGVLPDNRLWEALREAQLSPAVSALGGLGAQIQVNACLALSCLPACPLACLPALMAGGNGSWRLVFTQACCVDFKCRHSARVAPFPRSAARHRLCRRSCSRCCRRRGAT